MSSSLSPSASAAALRDGVVPPAADPAESPLTWFARRRGKDGRPLIAPHQLLAGERLRADFTRAQMMPRVTADWNASGVRGSRVPGALDPSETVLAAKQRVRNALGAVGPEFAGVLMDVCCFLKGLEQVEQEHGWPARAGKVVLTLALDRLARHYGYDARAVGRSNGRISTWIAPAGNAAE
ncbi:DUF6456 domain-containing protein [Ancylobacter sp. 6x-1]|uniref:DUF6456 domain-containing protein n=1 Tax=Ancylobacter crimeensis TaxID=2579147 RepID=A0ABT0D8W5_9HYPH|nr:DUF6456 domain-containing protein [Ancylobacter crimeensis]MCK0196377.1 DUF6456 domain-containing protein [Ancylobacter crimeensis]